MMITPTIKAKLYSLLGTRTPLIVEPKDFDDELINKAKELKREQIDVVGGKWRLHLFQYRTAMFVQIEDPDRELAYAVPAVKEAVAFKHSFKLFLEMASPIKPMMIGGGYYMVTMNHQDSGVISWAVRRLVEEKVVAKVTVERDKKAIELHGSPKWIFSPTDRQLKHIEFKVSEQQATDFAELKQWVREQMVEAGLITVREQLTIGRDVKISELFEAVKKKPGEKCFVLKSKRYKQEMKVYARDAKHAKDVAAVHDHNHWFTGAVGKDVSIEEVEE